MALDKKHEDGHCPNCYSKRADKMASYEDTGGDNHVDWISKYSVLECRGCGVHYFKASHSNSEDFEYFIDPHTGEHEKQYNESIEFWPPPAKRAAPDWANEIGAHDLVLGALFDDVYTALSNNLNVLAAIGMRTVFDRASELLNIEPNETFLKKLSKLRNEGHVSEKDEVVLSVLIDAGSAAAHRGWRPNPKQINDMMSILETFLHRAFLLPGIGAELEKVVPKRRK